MIVSYMPEKLEEIRDLKMSQSSSNSLSSGNAVPDFLLSEEILSVIPTDPYDQLDLARKITSLAISSRVSNLESELGRLRQKVSEKDRLILDLEQKVSTIERTHQENENRLMTVLDENAKLSKERDSLAISSKRLSRDLAKLETFKKQLIMSLNDDNSCLDESVETVTYNKSISREIGMKDNNISGSLNQRSSICSVESGNMTIDGNRNVKQHFSLTPYITPRLTPTTGTPKIISTAGSPLGYSMVSSPQINSGVTSPIKSKDARPSLTSWNTSSQQSSAASSPPHARPLPARPSRVDGKEFFRQARSRLSLSQFTAFLANIKELNAQKQSREETLRKAGEIFGLENKDLFHSFQGLLNRSAR